MEATSSYQFTIIIPVYNEEESLPRLEQVLSDYLPSCSMRACVLLIDDGSTDRSLTLIREMCARHEAFFFLSFVRNSGKSAALDAGFKACESPYLGYLDADLQTLPADFELLLPQALSHALVSGIRAHRRDTWFYRLQSKVGNRFRRWLTGDPATDTGCPLKVFQTSFAKRLPMFTGMHRFLCPLVLLQEGATYWETPVRHFPRQAGRSKYSFRSRFLPSFFDCLAFCWIRNRYLRYTLSDENKLC